MFDNNTLQFLFKQSLRPQLLLLYLIKQNKAKEKKASEIQSFYAPNLHNK